MPDLSEGQLNDISRRIADKLILEGEIRRWFADSPELIDQIVGQALPKIESAISFPALRKIKRAAPIRIRVNDGDVNADENSVQQGHAGPTLPDIINFHGATGWLETGDGRELHLTMGGGTDCMFDWLVSECYADLVAAGTHIEGQAFTSLTGCTFYVTSTVQNAWDGVGSGTGAKDFADDCTVFICPGGGVGGLIITGDNNVSASYVMFQGTNNRDSIIRAPSSATWSVDISGGAKKLIFRDLAFGRYQTSASTSEKPFRKTGGSGPFLAERCVFGASATSAPVFTNGSTSSITLIECVFPVNAASQYALDMSGYGDYTLAIDCIFDDAFRVGTETHLVDPVFHLGARAVGVIVPDVSGNTQLFCDGATFRTSGTAWTYYFQIDEPSITVEILNSQTNTGATAAVKFSSTFASDGTMQRIVNNSWSCNLGLDVTGASSGMIVTYTGNSHGGDVGAGMLTSTPIIARGRFANSVFEGNGPARGYVDFETGSTINRINGVQYGSGTPSHTANESQLYYDLATNTMYMNTSAESGTTWSVLGVSGGGAAAPSPHDLVSVHHDKEQTYESVLYLGELRLGVNGTAGDLTLYSDAGTTVVGTWDAATGHVVFGSNAAPDSTNIIIATKTFNNPASTILAFNTTLTNAMSGAGNSSPVTANQGIVRSSGAFTAAGIHSSFLANCTPASGAVISDNRGFYSLAQPASGTTIIDRYGLHVANGVNAGSITNQYGVYIENMTKGGTINRAIQSLGGLSTHLGAFRIGSNTAPTNTTNGDITGTRLIVPDATIVHSAITQLGGPVVIPAAGAIRFSDTDNSHYTGLAANGTTTSTVTYTLPAADGTSGQVLKTNASGVMSWGDVAHGNVSTTSMKSTLVLMAASGKPTTTQGCAAAQVIEAGTNDIDYWVLDFDDTSEERAFWNIVMPENWDASTLTAKFYWTSAAGASGETVRWGIQALCRGDDDAIDTAYGTAVEVSDDWIADGDVHVTDETSAMTPGGTGAAGDLMIIRVYRDTGDAADDHTGDARLIGVRLEFGITALSA